MVKEDLKSISWDYELDYTSEDIYNFLVGKLEIKDLRPQAQKALTGHLPAY